MAVMCPRSEDSHSYLVTEVAAYTGSRMSSPTAPSMELYFPEQCLNCGCSSVLFMLIKGSLVDSWILFFSLKNNGGPLKLAREIIPKKELARQIIPKKELARQIIPKKELGRQIIPKKELARQIIPKKRIRQANYSEKRISQANYSEKKN